MKRLFEFHTTGQSTDEAREDGKIFGLARRFNSAEDLEQTLLRYVALYNHQLPQSALQSKTPIQAMKQWYQTHPELFYKRPYDRPGCDNYWEEEMDPEIRQAELLGEPDPRAKLSLIGRLLPLPFLFANTLGQWLCYWPTFPKAWNSDCGQKRRESGIGPEEPLRWEAKL